ncbi:MAG: A24 family peptidase [Wenzhouxiangellaceae bacterium]|nr:A24 family peptidase [Wenzhouxiangellaceae bacterium]
MELLQQLPPAWLYGLVVVLGLLVGSFLNVVILRVPLALIDDWKCQCRELLDLPPDAEGEKPAGVSEGRSRCPECRKKIAWYDNIPIVSWALLRARCRHCGAKISPRYPVVEALTAVLSVLVVWKLGPTPEGLAGLALTWALIAAAGIDIDHKLLPDQITLPLLWAGLLLNVGGTFTDLGSAVIGAAAGYLVLWSVYHAFRLLTGKEGMGFGDFKLLAAIGAWFGWQVLPAVILLAAGVGALVGIALIALRFTGREVPIAFGPFLAAAGWLVLMDLHRFVEFWLLP